MPAPVLTTYRDIIDALLGFVGGSPEEKLVRDIRSAIQSAYRDLVYQREWNYFYRQHILHTSAPYSTGTVAYSSTTRELTLTSGTWPTWAIYGHVVIDQVVYRVASRDSSTVLTLEYAACPVADIAAGTTYTIFRSIYTLPSDFRSMAAPSDEGRSWYTAYCTPTDWMRLEQQNPTSGNVTAWTVMGDPNLIGSFAVYMYPYPDTQRTFPLYYQAEARPMRRTGYVSTENASAGTATITAATATVTLSGATAVADMIGSVFRITSGTTVPDGLDGLNPWAEQKMIVDVPTTSTLLVDSNFTNSYAAKKYVISDPVDLPARMVEAFLRGCESQLANKKNMSTLAERRRLYEQALRRCMESDSTRLGASYRTGSPSWSPGRDFGDMLPTTYEP